MHVLTAYKGDDPIFLRKLLPLLFNCLTHLDLFNNSNFFTDTMHSWHLNPSSNRSLVCWVPVLTKPASSLVSCLIKNP